MKLIILSLLFFNLSISLASAQVQEVPFSGNDPASYQCLGADGAIDPTLVPYKHNVTGEMVCPIDRNGDGDDDQALLKPPTLQQVEIWFVRILYVVWGLVAAYSFLMLVALGYQYMVRGGTSDTELVTLRKRIIYYIVGVAIVFLAVPILSTIFTLMQINDEVDCYDVNMPGFQFFYADLCTDPSGNISDEVISNPCNFDNAGEAVGKACPANFIGTSSTCSFGGGNMVQFTCSGDRTSDSFGIWTASHL